MSDIAKLRSKSQTVSSQAAPRSRASAPQASSSPGTRGRGLTASKQRAKIRDEAKSLYARKDTHRELRDNTPAVKDPARTEAFTTYVTRRVTKFTDERIQVLLQALLDGNYRVTAAALAGITFETMRNWMAKGEAQESGEFRDFYEAVLEAEAMCESDILKNVRKAIPKDWRAGMEILRRRHPDRLGRDKVELTGSDGGTLVVRVVYDDVKRAAEEDLV